MTPDELERRIVKLEQLRKLDNQRYDNEIDILKRAVTDSKENMKEKVGVDRFLPVEKIVIGMIALVLSSFLLAAIAIVLNRTAG